MSVIIISSDSLDTEREVAQGVAKAKGFGIVGRELLGDVASFCKVDVAVIERALECTPSILKRMPPARWAFYLASIEAEVLDRLRADNLVCWGVAAHLYVVGVSHAMKVRLISNIDRRAEAMAKLHGMSEEKAAKWIETDEKRRRKWSLYAYKTDETDPSVYDLVVNLDQIDQAEAVKTIADAVGYRKFKPVTYSIKCLSDLAIAARVRAELLRSMKDVRVEARDGTVIVFVKGSEREKRAKNQEIKDIAGKIDGVSFVEVHVRKDIAKIAGMGPTDRSKYPDWPVSGK